MVTKKRRVRRTPDSYRMEVSEITNGEYSVLDDFVNTTTKVLHTHKECGYVWAVKPTVFLHNGSRCPKCCHVRKGRTPESYKREVVEITDGEYSVLGRYINATSKVTHKHIGCGYEWEVAPNTFVNIGTRCPRCSKKERRTPEGYIKEVADLTDGEYSVLGEYVNAKTKVLHAHNVCGHEWEVRPSSFISKSTRCPKCYARSRVSHTPESYREEVSEITGGEYLVLDDFKGVISKIKHLHSVCDHVWEVTPSSFISHGSRCPKCHTRKSRKTNEQFVAEVYDLVGDEYTFLDEYTFSSNKIKVLHKDCGHSYRVSPNSFISQGSRCPNCVYSRGEKAIADVLDSLSIEYIREHSFEYLGLKRYDFFIPSLNIAIEYDGEQHFDAVDLWGGEEALKRTQESDALKNDFCEYMGIDLLRIPYWEFDNIDEIVTNFIDTVKLMRSISASGSEMAKCR